MKVLVTGANGFIGKETCIELEKTGCEVIKFVSKKNYLEKESSLNNVFAVDITDLDLSLYKSEVGSIDAVIHIAGLAHQFGNVTQEGFENVNIEGTRNVAKLAAKIQAKHFIHISSVSVYGNLKQDSKQSFDEESPCNPKGAYAISKLKAEEVCKNVFRNTNTRLTILRPATVIGKGDKGNVYRLILLINRRKFFWIGKGVNKKSLIHKRDVARAIINVLQKQKEEEEKVETLNVIGDHLQMKQIVQIISDELGVKIRPIKIPSVLITEIFRILTFVFRFSKLQEIKKKVNKWLSDDIYSGDKILKKYNFETEVLVREALIEEVKWVKEKNN